MVTRPPSPSSEPAPTAGPVLHRGADATEQAREVAALVADQLQQALAQRPRATLVVSGGRTPVAMWQALREAPLDWRRVDITLADERWVPPDHPASNEGLLQQHLLQGPAAQAHWWPLFNGAATPAEGLGLLEASLAQGPSWPADVVVLGMGSDGHTASWFPHQALPDGAQRCMAVAAPPPPNVVEPRVSLTPAALLSARCLLVHLQGRDKESTLLQALLPPGFDEAQQALALPIRRALWAPGQACQVFYTP